MIPNLILVNSKTKFSLHFSFSFFLKAFINIFKINFTKHGDKSKVNNLNKSIALFIVWESITESIKFFKFDNFSDIEGFITFKLPLY